MRLGEALSERARLQRRIGELRARIGDNAAMQEGEQPAEDAVALINEVLLVHEELATLIARINITNAHTVFDGTTLTGMLAQREMLSGMINTLNAAATAAQEGNQPRYMRSELRLVRQVDVADLRSQADQRSAELRDLDNDIQQINWTTDLANL